MKKKNSIQKRKLELKKEQELQKSQEERHTVRSSVESRFRDVVFVAVDPEFKEVTFDVHPDEFIHCKKDFSTDVANFKFEKEDSSMYSLTFKYELK